MTQIGFLTACHNRKSQTVASIIAAMNAVQTAGMNACFYLYDDGSSDGTAQAVNELGYDIHVVEGSGNDFWAKGMATAESEALRPDAHFCPDFLIWLNDDVILTRNSVEIAIAELKKNPGAIIVGAMQDPTSGKTTYSAFRRSGIHPLRFEILVPSEVFQLADSFNGNFVVVPTDIARRLGGIDGEFAHALADIDYGLRARAAGIPVLLAPGHLGSCARNPERVPLARKDEWEHFLGKKGGGHFESNVRFMKRHGNITWPLFLGGSYVLWWVRALRNSLTKIGARGGR